MANFCAFGQIFLFQRAKYWTSDLVIWSHCTNRKRLQEELYFGISLFTDRLTVLYLPTMMTMSLSWWLWPTKAVVILIIGTYSIFCKYFVYPTATIQNGSAVLNHFICYLLNYPPPPSTEGFVFMKKDSFIFFFSNWLPLFGLYKHSSTYNVDNKSMWLFNLDLNSRPLGLESPPVFNLTNARCTIENNGTKVVLKSNF